MKETLLASSFKEVVSVFEKFAGDVQGKAVAFIPATSVVEKVKKWDLAKKQIKR